MGLLYFHVKTYLFVDRIILNCQGKITIEFLSMGSLCTMFMSPLRLFSSKSKERDGEAEDCSEEAVM